MKERRLYLVMSPKEPEVLRLSFWECILLETLDIRYFAFSEESHESL